MDPKVIGASEGEGADGGDHARFLLWYSCGCCDFNHEVDDDVEDENVAAGTVREDEEDDAVPAVSEVEDGDSSGSDGEGGEPGDGSETGGGRAGCWLEACSKSTLPVIGARLISGRRAT